MNSAPRLRLPRWYIGPQVFNDNYNYPSMTTSGSFVMWIAIFRLWCAGDAVSGGECKLRSHLARGGAGGSALAVLPVCHPTRRELDFGSRRGRQLQARR